MIEPDGTHIDIIGTPDRQSKVPQHGTPQPQSTVYMPAQSDRGFGNVGTAGLSDMVPSSTKRLDSCLIQGQDSRSHQGAFVPSVGAINKGASGIGATPIGAGLRAGTPTEVQVNAPSPSRVDAMLFPGIID